MSLRQLVADGDLDPLCEQIFRGVDLYAHQAQSIALAAAGKSFVVTTGTGSGKSLCFFIPIVDGILKAKRKDPRRRTRAIIVYPMNALANSQLEEIHKYLENVPGPAPITVAPYTGQEDEAARRAVAEDPPDILLTNFMRLELLMTRQGELDWRVMANCAGLQYLVLDELHTYRGRQGADVALLVRRVRERLAPDGLQCIGTSATMSSEERQAERNKVVADVASRLFAAEIPPDRVVIETLMRQMEPTAEQIRHGLAAAIDAGIPDDAADALLKMSALAAWVETSLGIRFSEVNQHWERARPISLTEAVFRQSRDSGRPEGVCPAALRKLLLVSSLSERDRTGSGSERSFFAFKLRQFISGAGQAFTTFEEPGVRAVTVEGQQFLTEAPTKRLYPVQFCRACGQEYYPVRRIRSNGRTTFLPCSATSNPGRRATRTASGWTPTTGSCSPRTSTPRSIRASSPSRTMAGWSSPLPCRETPGRCSA